MTKENESKPLEQHKKQKSMPLENEFNLSKKREKLREDIKYLFDKIDWGASFLDAKAIQIMNEFVKDIEDADKEFIRRLKEEIEPLRYDIKIDQANRLIKAIDKLAGEKLIK
jgi:hypothetical protein